MSALVQLVIQLGLPSALVLFFVFYGQKREERLSATVAELEHEYRNTLVSLIRQTDVHMERHTGIMVDLVETVKESNKQVTALILQMNERPCLIHPTGSNG